MERKNRTQGILALLLFLFCGEVHGQSIPAPTQDSTHTAFVRAIYSEALSAKQGYQWLSDLCATVGPRLACSPGDAAAVKWAKQTLDTLGFDTVYTQTVTGNTHWIRGDAWARAHSGGKKISLSIAALGGSESTPGGDKGKGLRAQVVEVLSFQELDDLAAAGKIKGKIVFYNRPMDPTYINTGSAYGRAVDQRWAGAMEASKHGAVAVLVRSMTLSLDDFPHTGVMSYGEEKNKIPAAGISTLDAEALHTLLAKDPTTEVSLLLGAHTVGTCTSYNVIAEWRGSDKLEEIVVAGGHLDSWDLGTGAQDDGAGSVQSMHALYLLKKLGYQPHRTHRVVLFANEEFGLVGGMHYAANALEKKEKHALAIESDGGSGSPRGFSFENEEARSALQKFQPYVAPYGLLSFSVGGSGADVGQLAGQGSFLAGLSVDTQRYFDYHHTAQDRIESIHPRELELGAAAMSALLYLFDAHSPIPSAP